MAWSTTTTQSTIHHHRNNPQLDQQPITTAKTQSLLGTHPNHHKPIREKDERESDDSERERERMIEK